MEQMWRIQCAWREDWESWRRRNQGCKACKTGERKEQDGEAVSVISPDTVVEDQRDEQQHARIGELTESLNQANRLRLQRRLFLFFVIQGLINQTFLLIVE